MDTVRWTVAGLDGPVGIVRDEWGIPHVRARTEHDAFFGQGFVQAEDRLGQLEYDRRRALGRWAEVAGPSAVPFDAFTRRLGLGLAAEREYAALSSDARAVLDAFAAGVNAYLDLGRPLPTDLALAGVDPEPWLPWHANAVFLVRHVVFANWQKKLWRARVAEVLGSEAAVRLERDDRPVPLVVPPDTTAEPLHLDASNFGAVADAVRVLVAADPELLGAIALAGDTEAEEVGSNAWALTGRRTASGRPLLAGDPHRQVEVPGVYVQNHLACDTFDAIGLSFVGVPGFPHFGHNADVAWCVTNAYGDSQDLFVEQFAPDVLPTRVETIDVRGSDAVVVECHAGSQGPVAFGDPRRGAAITMRSTALPTPSRGLEVLAPMLRVRTADALRAVMADWVDPVNNLLCADREGTVVYQTVGVIPERAAANACGPVPGWDDAHHWIGTIAYDDLPTVRDPASGVLVTANQRIVGDEYPYHLSDGYSRPDRAERIHARLRTLDHATVDDMAAIHRDVFSLRAPLWIARLGALRPTDPYERAALDLVREWGGEMHADSGAAAVYMVTRDAVCRRLAHHPGLTPLRAAARDEPPGGYVAPATRLWPVVSALLAADDPTLLAVGDGWGDVLAAALADAVGVLRSRLGDDPAAWSWGALHVSAPSHPLSAVHPEWEGSLDPPAVEMAGEWDTVFASAHAAGHGFAVTGASVARYVFDLADWDASGWVVPLGASGECTSPHFADQRAAWAAGMLLPMRWSGPVLDAHAGDRTELVTDR